MSDKNKVRAECHALCGFDRPIRSGATPVPPSAKWFLSSYLDGCGVNETESLAAACRRDSGTIAYGATATRYKAMTDEAPKPLTFEEERRMRGCVGLDFPVEAMLRLFATIDALRSELEKLKSAERESDLVAEHDAEGIRDVGEVFGVGAWGGKPSRGAYQMSKPRWKSQHARSPAFEKLRGHCRRVPSRYTSSTRPRPAVSSVASERRQPNWNRTPSATKRPRIRS